MEAINYSQEVILSIEEKTRMYNKLTKAELIKLLLENQRLLELLAPSLPYSLSLPLPDVWHGINHPSTGDPIYPSYTISTTVEYVGN